MKIYNKLVIDIESGDILYEDSYEYEGPLALCDYDDDMDSWSGSDDDFGGADQDGESDTAMGGGYGTGGYEGMADWGDVGRAESYRTGTGSGGQGGDYPGELGVTIADLENQRILSDKDMTSIIAEKAKEGMWRGMKDVSKQAKGGTFIAGMAINSVVPLAGTVAGLLTAVVINNYNIQQQNNQALLSAGYTQPQIDSFNARNGVTTISLEDANTVSLGGSEGEETAKKVLNSLSPVEQSQVAKTVTQGVSDVNKANILNQLNNLMGTGFTMDNLGTTREMGTEFRDMMGASLADLTKISKIHELSELTGELPAYEKELLNKIKNNAMLNLTEIVNDETADIVKNEIASLVDRGVLRGNIGTQALAKIDEKRTQALVQGGRDIETAVMEKELGMIGEQKGNELKLWEQEQTREIDLLKIGEDRWKTATQLDLDKYKSDIVWDTSRMNALTDMWKAEKSAETAASGQASDWSIAQMQADAQETAAQWNTWSNLGNTAMWMMM